MDELWRITASRTPQSWAEIVWIPPLLINNSILILKPVQFFLKKLKTLGLNIIFLLRLDEREVVIPVNNYHF